ncbi:MAG: hypothetical protein ACFCGT_05605 [Sandaracinaceae bacterium]
MLSRYRIVRGRRPPDEPLPEGERVVRVDIRKHVRHVLAPDPHDVAAYLVDPADPARFAAFRAAYLRRLEERYEATPDAFVEIAERARRHDVYLGCSCPTRKQPDVSRCHTVLALRFFAQRFEDLEVRFPEEAASGRAPRG